MTPGRGLHFTMFAGFVTLAIATASGSLTGTRRSTVSYSVTVKNITVSVDDETYRTARIAAARQDTSVSALVKKFLQGLSDESEYERLKRLEAEARAKITSFSASDNVSRDELYTSRR